MTNYEYIMELPNSKFAPLIISTVLYNINNTDSTYGYKCPDNKCFSEYTEAINHTIDWLETEVSKEVSNRDLIKYNTVETFAGFFLEEGLYRKKDSSELEIKYTNLFTKKTYKSKESAVKAVMEFLKTERKIQ